MNRTHLLALLSLALTFSPPAVRGASITYKIQSYPAYQNGFTLSGTITTDGTISPTFTPNDITAYALTYSNSINTYTVSGSPFTTGGVDYLGSIGATPIELTIANPGLSGMNVLTLQDANGGSGRSITWAEGGGTSQYDAVISSSNPSFAWNALNLPANALGGDPWVIASIPEPGSLTLALLGGACLAVVEWTRRRRRVASRPQAIPTAHS